MLKKKDNVLKISKLSQKLLDDLVEAAALGWENHKRYLDHFTLHFINCEAAMIKRIKQLEDSNKKLRKQLGR